ncbi:MAG TPA: hypothetical protein VMV14_11010 [Acidimicrobiales bacterium]|nr:hypothetical protein [Acidimicrobiales bacterium]
MPARPPLGADPPVDPEEWTDEQWLAWLSATDAELPPPAETARVTARFKDRPAGQVLAAAMLGLPVVHLDRDHSERSHVTVRAKRPRARRRG